CQSGAWRQAAAKFELTAEYVAGYQQTVRMIASTEGFCFPTLIGMASLNNYDSYWGKIYIAADGFWYLSTTDSSYPRGQSMYARCVRT
ncbi:hypothetical protein, partial [Pseudomonas reactans]|uniref:hypothetical protein n=1 Tax=Pseudomonas reactans TaxID=117680 RepID=UPI001C432D24